MQDLYHQPQYAAYGWPGLTDPDGQSQSRGKEALHSYVEKLCCIQPPKPTTRLLLVPSTVDRSVKLPYLPVQGPRYRALSIFLKKDPPASGPQAEFSLSINHTHTHTLNLLTP